MLDLVFRVQSDLLDVPQVNWPDANSVKSPLRTLPSESVTMTFRSTASSAAGHGLHRLPTLEYTRNAIAQRDVSSALLGGEGGQT